MCRTVTVNLQKIFGFWAEYENGDRSALQLLRAYARLYGPRLWASQGGLLLSTVIQNKPSDIYIIPIEYRPL